MEINFKRIISKGNFIPEIDGLRFIAIAIVVFSHLNSFLVEKDTNLYDVEYNFDILNNMLSLGHLGVSLFFVVSGFILARPFAQMHLSNRPTINIKKYFLRRLTRLEPPYIIVMTALLIAVIYVAKTVSLGEALISYLSSITYTHNFIYGKDTLPLLNAVAWSLEIEVQFYVLMPLLARVFMLKNTIKRRATIIIFGLIFLIIDHFESMSFVSIINYIEYFLIGLLLADIYVSNNGKFKTTKFDSIFTLLFFVLIWLSAMIKTDSILLVLSLNIIQLFSFFAFNYLVIFHRSIKQLANPIITNIGGMCYTIYLIHYPLISLFGNPLMKINFTNNSILNTVVYSTILLVIVMIFSSIYFLLIERPCMDKDWYKKLLKNYRF